MGRRRATRALLALLACATSLAAWSAGAMAERASHRRPAAVAAAKTRKAAPTVTVGPGLVSTPGAPVTMTPAGLSIEYSVMAADLASQPCPSSALAAELLRLGSPPLELAGVSQDMTAPAGALSEATSWETASIYSLPVGFWSQLRCLLETAKDPLTVGLNLRTGNLAWATQMAAEAEGAATDGLSFSLGNEPDLYRLPNYSALDKPQAGEEAAAADRYVQLATYLRPALGTAPLIGPELSRPASWRNALPHVIEALHEQTVGVHLYPLTDCVTPRAVTISGLLSGQAADAPARLAWVVADARAAGLQAVISEANSASCGGLAGVSDTPAAAVWAVRFDLSALKTGFGEVRFHFSGDPYDPFIVRGAEVVPRPIESALVALNTWLPVGSTLRTVPGVRELLATAVAEPGGGIVLILDNESSRARQVLLRGAQPLTATALNPARAGLQPVPLRTSGGRTRLAVAANGIVAVSTSAPGAG